jgi:hypothetical protein
MDLLAEQFEPLPEDIDKPKRLCEQISQLCKNRPHDSPESAPDFPA